MILVAGATGMLGSEICRLITQDKKRARALVRASSDAAAVKTLADLGVETIVSDVRDRGSLANACSAVEAVICTISSMPTRYQAGSNDIASVDRDGAWEWQPVST